MISQTYPLAFKACCSPIRSGQLRTRGGVALRCQSWPAPSALVHVVRHLADQPRGASAGASRPPPSTQSVRHERPQVFWLFRGTRTPRRANPSVHSRCSTCRTPKGLGDRMVASPQQASCRHSFEPPAFQDDSRRANRVKLETGVLQESVVATLVFPSVCRYLAAGSPRPG